jgi:nucleotide-binding universal stress UspA family protein
MTFDTLLIPSDGSAQAEAAATAGFDLAAQLDAAVQVLSVVDSGLATSATYVGDSPRIHDLLREQADAPVTRLAAEARERGLDVEPVVREGIPAQAIVGSLTDEIVRTASAPVLMVRAGTSDSLVTDGYGEEE